MDISENEPLSNDEEVTIVDLDTAESRLRSSSKKDGARGTAKVFSLGKLSLLIQKNSFTARLSKGRFRWAMALLTVAGSVILLFQVAPGYFHWNEPSSNIAPTLTSALTNPPAQRSFFVDSINGVSYAVSFDPKMGTPVAGMTLTALDTRSGKQLWHLSDALFSWPTIGRDAVYISSIKKGIQALNLRTGKQLWQYNKGPLMQIQTIIEQNEHDDVIYAQEPGKRVLALRPHDGVERWSVNTPGIVSFQTTQIVCIKEQDQTLHVLRASDGQELWHYDIRSNDIPEYVMGDGTIYTVKDGNLLALRAKDGTELWRRENVGSVNIIVDDTNLYLFSNNHESVHVLRAKDGTELWHSMFGQLCVPFSSVLYSYTLQDDTLRVLRKNDGALLWQYYIHGVPEIQEIKGVAYLFSGDDHALYALRMADGQELWQRQNVDQYTFFPSSNTMYISSTHERSVQAVRLSDGRQVWSNKVNSDVNILQNADNGTLYLALTQQGLLIALDANNGAERWRYRAPLQPEQSHF